MMTTLGYFVFSRNTAAYQTSQHDISWRHASNNRIGARPSSQFLGVGDETKALSGVLYPQLTGGEPDLNQLIEMANTGNAYPLIDGNGNVEGFFKIMKIGRGRSEFFPDGTARKIEFSIELKRVDEKDTNQIAQNLSTNQG